VPIPSMEGLWLKTHDFGHGSFWTFSANCSRGGHDDRLRQAVADEVARERSRPGDAAHICPALWGVTDAGAGRYVACGGLTL
jgi:hypothetical protein